MPYFYPYAFVNKASLDIEFVDVLAAVPEEPAQHRLVPLTRAGFPSKASVVEHLSKEFPEALRKLKPSAPEGLAPTNDPVQKARWEALSAPESDMEDLLFLPLSDEQDEPENVFVLGDC